MQGAPALTVKGNDRQKSLFIPSAGSLQPHRCTDRLPDTHSVHCCAATGSTPCLGKHRQLQQWVTHLPCVQKCTDSP